MNAGLLADWEQAERRAERRRWSWSTLAILLSGTAVAVGLQWQAFHTATPLPPAAAMVIELMPLQAPPSPPSAQPEGEQQVEAPKPQPPKPLPKPRLELAKSEIALPDEPEPAQEEEIQEQPPAPQTSAPPNVEAPPAQTASAPRQSAYSQAASAAKVTFEQRLLGHLERHKRYPRAAQLRRQQGMPYIRFTMDRNGQVLSSSLERGTGHALLDEEALALLARAQPLPAMPQELPGATMEIVVPIEFFLSRRR